MHESNKDTVQNAANSVSSIPNLMGDDEDGYPAEPPGAPALLLNHDGTPMYHYRDFGHVEEDDEEVNSEIPAPTPTSRGGSESSIRVQKFPVKLYAILAQKEFHDIICWMPHGRSWKVLKPSMFESLVMPLFFEYSNYHSFNRLVNAWSFRRISSGPDRGSYYHELFLRGKPHLQNYMRRLPKTHKKLPMKKKDEPDFYKLDHTNPLPETHEAPVPGAAATVQAIRAGAGVQQPGSPYNNMHMQANTVVVTPHVSPSHAGANIIGGPNSYHMASPSVGNMNGIGSNMSGLGNMNDMGPGNMGMGNINDSGHSNIGLNRMSGMGTGNMGGMGGMGPNGMGMGPSGMSYMGPGNMDMHGGASLNPRFDGYGDYIGDNFQDEYDIMQHQSMMGRGGGGSIGGQQPHHMSHMNNNGGYGGNSGYSKMVPSTQNSIRRPVVMRQGSGMDHMHGGDRSHAQRQPEFYQGYSPQPQMTMHGMQQHHDMYSRGGSASIPGLQDDYSTSSNGGNMPHRHVTKMTGPRV